MARFSSGRQGVHVYTDSGIYVGTAHRRAGKPLSSKHALAQLGVTEGEGGQLKALTGAARAAALEE